MPHFNSRLSPYLDGKRQDLLQLLAQVKHDPLAASLIQQQVPIAEKKLREVSLWYKDICAKKLLDLIGVVENESVGAAKSLEPLDTAGKRWGDSKKGAWTKIIGSGVGGLVLGALLIWAVGLWGVIMLPLAAIAPYLLYRNYRTLAQNVYASRRVKTPTRLQESIARYDLILLQFAPGKTGNFSQNYHGTQITLDGSSDLMQVWELDPEKYGNLYGATFLGIKESSDDNQVSTLLKLSDSNKAPECIELRSGVFHNIRYVKNDFLSYIAKESPSLIAAITPITQGLEQNEIRKKKEQELLNQLAELDTQIQEIQQIIVESSSLDALLMHIDTFRAGGSTAPRGLLLYGPSGTGKTKIGVTLATATRCGYLRVDTAELKSGGKGTVADKVKKLWRRAFLQAPCILFLDDCDSVFDPRMDGLDKNSVERELADSFMAEWSAQHMTPGKVLVLGATSRREAMDMSVLLSFDQVFEIGLPTEHLRERILQQEFKLASINGVVSDSMIKSTAGMAGREIQQLAMRIKGLLQGQPLNDATFSEAIKNIRSKASTLTESVAWQDVVLPPQIKSKLQYLAKKIKQTEEYAKMGLPVSKSLLLYGPPGTGKTQIARALATESGLSFMAATTADIKSKTVGESGKLVQLLFDRARSQSPCLLFIDEIDIVTGSRTNTDLIGQEIVGQLLQEMDGINSRASSGQVFVMGATNNRDIIDTAVLSRFNDQEEIVLPTEQGRAEIIALNLHKKPVAFDIDKLSKRVAQATEGLSGRDLFSLVNSAASCAMQRADELHLEIKDIKLEEYDFEGLTIGGRTIHLDPEFE